MTKQVTLENTRAGGFGLPGGETIPGGGSISVDVTVWDACKDHPVVVSVVKDGWIIVDGKGKKKPVADERDENGDTAEMAQLRASFNAAYDALKVELQAERERVAERDARIAELEKAPNKVKT